jgi:hypothetical protein
MGGCAVCVQGAACLANRYAVRRHSGLRSDCASPHNSGAIGEV